MADEIPTAPGLRAPPHTFACKRGPGRTPEGNAEGAVIGQAGEEARAEAKGLRGCATGVGDVTHVADHSSKVDRGPGPDCESPARTIGPQARFYASASEEERVATGRIV